MFILLQFKELMNKIDKDEEEEDEDGNPIERPASYTPSKYRPNNSISNHGGGAGSGTVTPIKLSKVGGGGGGGGASNQLPAGTSAQQALLEIQNQQLKKMEEQNRRIMQEKMAKRGGGSVNSSHGFAPTRSSGGGGSSKAESFVLDPETGMMIPGPSGADNGEDVQVLDRANQPVVVNLGQLSHKNSNSVSTQVCVCFYLFRCSHHTSPFHLLDRIFPIFQNLFFKYEADLKIIFSGLLPFYTPHCA